MFELADKVMILNRDRVKEFVTSGGGSGRNLLDCETAPQKDMNKELL
jgi:hypothetical protein